MALNLFCLNKTYFKYILKNLMLNLFIIKPQKWFLYRELRIIKALLNFTYLLENKN